MAAVVIVAEVLTTAVMFFSFSCRMYFKQSNMFLANSHSGFFYIICVVCNLCFITCVLLIAVSTNSTVYRDSEFRIFIYASFLASIYKRKFTKVFFIKLSNLSGNILINNSNAIFNSIVKRCISCFICSVLDSFFN